MMSNLGVTSMAVAAVYYRFSWQMEGGAVPVSEMFGTFALSVGEAVGMEFWARWAHRALWHASLWHMHESHHRPREGPFELNDVFAIVNAVSAISLLGDVVSRYTTWTSLRASRMGSSWDQRSWRRSMAWTSWKRSSRESAGPSDGFIRIPARRSPLRSVIPAQPHGWGADDQNLQKGFGLDARA
uniref:beta-carotene 3-hydroxylase n=1 Tax=Zea mays TaxID=4577 RepID=B6T9F2_MAIZE|nr:hypothetical protein [Zea mays]